MTLAYLATYATLPETQYEDGGSITLQHIAAASQVIAEKRRYPLFLPATELRITREAMPSLDLRRHYWQLPIPLQKVTSVQLQEALYRTGDATDVDLDTVTVNGRTLLIEDEDIVYEGRAYTDLIVTGDWGDAQRAGAINYEADIAADAAMIANPDPTPSWWQVGQMIVINDELARIDAVGAAQTELMRIDGVAHDYEPGEDGPMIKIHRLIVPAKLSEVAIGLARRIAWTQRNVETKPVWSSLIDGYEPLMLLQPSDLR